MKSRLLSLTLAVPLAAAGALSISSAASAAIFGPGLNQLNFGVSFDLQNLNYQRFAPGLPGLSNPTDLILKGAGLQNPTAAPGTQLGTTGTGNGTNIPGPANDSAIVDFLTGDPSAPIGISTVNVGGVGFTICNVGGFTSTTCTPASISDFIINTSVASINKAAILMAGQGIVNPFITVLGAGAAAGLNYSFELDKTTIDTSIPGQSILQFAGTPTTGSTPCAVNPGQAGCEGFIDFFAKGKLTILGIPADPEFAGELGKVYDVSYSYAGPRLAVDAANSTSCGPNPGDMCRIEFIQTTGAGNIRATITPVPEPGTVGALLGLGVIGSFGALKRKKLGK